jgi:hypothetical protein
MTLDRAVRRSHISHCAASTGCYANGHSSPVDRPGRALGATAASGRDDAAAAVRARACCGLAARSLDLGRLGLELAARSVCRTAIAAGGVGTQTVGPTAIRRLRLGRWASGGLKMHRQSAWWIGFGALVLLGGCVREEPAPTPSAQVIVQQPAQPVAPRVAPGPPPPPHSELVPPPPQGSGPVVWQPGHWALGNSGWAWQPGQYVPPPLGETTWVPGRWVQQSSGGWIWQEGHWA